MMDSIFQIRINENKLHKILSDLAKDQSKLSDHVRAIDDHFLKSIEDNKNNHEKMLGQIKQL